MRQTDSHLFAEMSRMRYALSIADVHLVYLAVGWMNSHRGKGQDPVKPPEFYESEKDDVQVSDADREHAANLLTSWASME